MAQTSFVHGWYALLMVLMPTVPMVGVAVWTLPN